MRRQDSYRTILWSSSVLGAAAFINIFVSLARMKAAAVLLGPAGVGIIGLITNLMQTGATVAALGSGTAGTRQIAEARTQSTDQHVQRARAALIWGSLLLAVLGGGVFFLLRLPIANAVLQDATQAGQVGWLSLGVFLSVISGSQLALLNGFRRIGDLARIQVLAGLLSAAMGVAALVVWRERGVVFFVISAPLASFALGYWYLRKLESPSPVPTGRAALFKEWGVLARLGTAFMLSGLVTLVGQLLVRMVIQRDLGETALGLFQAAWSISMTYIGFVMSAMGRDYYPRLTAAMTDAASARRLINEQTEVALFLAGPVLVVMTATAPFVITALYHSDFHGAASLLRWQVVGDVLKIASWPLGFLLLAAGAGKTFILTETIAMAVFVGATALLLPSFGILASGISFVALYLIYLGMQAYLARRRIQMRWSRDVKFQLSVVLGCCISVPLTSLYSELLAVVLGSAAAACLSVWAILRLGEKSALSGRAGDFIRACNGLLHRLRRL